MRKRNDYNKVDDFFADASFLNWIRENEDPTNWEEWTLESTERAKLVEEARLWILAMKVEVTQISDKETQLALKKTWEKINKTANQKPGKVIWHSAWFRSAAAILVIALTTLIFLLKNTGTETISYQNLVDKNTDGLIEQTNNSEKPQLITLSDASSVLLLPKSKLSYPKIFKGNERKVYLSGEGFFEISKDPENPFYVYANETVTKVYGTSFRVIAYANQPKVEVLVKTGKVKVSSNSQINNTNTEEVVLLPNQAARFLRKELSFEKIPDITQDKQLLANTNTIEQISFEFRDIPVYQIFKTIEEAYLVNIIFPNDKLKNCYLTTSLNDQPLPEKLKIICESLGNNTSYEMNGNNIKIISNGCN